MISVYKLIAKDDSWYKWVVFDSITHESIRCDNADNLRFHQFWCRKDPKSMPAEVYELIHSYETREEFNNFYKDFPEEFI